MKQRLKNYRFGLVAEWVVCWYLRLTCHHILARRLRNHSGEIDIIARKDKCLIFIEVKARKNQVHLQDVLSLRQKTRIMKAAELYMASYPRFIGYDMRYDLITLSGFSLVHLKNAWGTNY